MISGKVIIRNPIGLHLRPARILCQEALEFKSSISFRIRNTTANAKSVLSVLGAGVKHGDEIELICEGEDEQAAFDTLMAMIHSGLGDELENIGIDK
jgi:phosphocarrier protein